MQESRRSCLIALVSVTLLGCLGLLCLSAAGVSAFLFWPQNPTPAVAGPVVITAPPTPVPLGATSTPLPPTPTNTPGPAGAPPTATPVMAIPSVTVSARPESPYPVPAAIDWSPVPAGATDDLEALYAVDFPVHDYYEAAQRLSGDDLGPRTKVVEPYVVGNRRQFITDRGNATAELVAVTANTYFWVEEGSGLDPADVRAAAERFERDYYPRLLLLFGEGWKPGMDGDPRFSVLHLRRFNGTELGFFDSSDEYPQSIASASNEQEIIYLNLSRLDLGSPLYYATLVHEYQHLVQWYSDGNEAVWLDEGLAQLAELYVGLDTIETGDYLSNPDLQLNAWSYDDSDDVYGHYAASYLFLAYLWEQLGDAAIQELARHPANGMQAVRAVLNGYRPGVTLEAFIGDWATANWLDGRSADPLYDYSSLILSQPGIEASFRTPAETVNDIVPLGVHYLDLDRSGATTLTFAGQTRTRLLPIDAHSGSRLWAVPGTDNVSARLTAAFDLSSVREATLSFWTWYDLEADYDFAYVSLSTDGGATWRLLLPDNGTAGDYGPAFNGRSDAARGHVNGWLREEIALDAFTGQTVLIRFEVLSDGGLSGAGFALDDLAIPEIGYASDVEGGPDGWEAAGFLQTGNTLPQLWELRLIDHDTGTVTPLILDANNQLQTTLNLGPDGATLVVVPVTPFVYEATRYWIQIE